MYDYLDDRQTKRLKELVPYKVLAPDADEIIKELERLNNIINGLEKFLNKVVETGASIEQITCKNILNYLKELKENNKDE